MIRPLLICAALTLPLALGACESMGMGGNTASSSTVSRDSSGAPGPISQTTQNGGAQRSDPGPQNP